MPINNETDKGLEIDLTENSQSGQKCPYLSHNGHKISQDNIENNAFQSFGVADHQGAFISDIALQLGCNDPSATTLEPSKYRENAPLSSDLILKKLTSQLLTFEELQEGIQKGLIKWEEINFRPDVVKLALDRVNKKR